MARGRSAEKIKQEINALNEELKQTEDREALRIGRIAVKAGIDRLDMKDAELSKIFAGIAQSFRNEDNKMHLAVAAAEAENQAPSTL